MINRRIAAARLKFLINRQERFQDISVDPIIDTLIISYRPFKPKCFGSPYFLLPRKPHDGVETKTGLFIYTYLRNNPGYEFPVVHIIRDIFQNGLQGQTVFEVGAKVRHLRLRSGISIVREFRAQPELPVRVVDHILLGPEHNFRVVVAVGQPVGSKKRAIFPQVAFLIIQVQYGSFAVDPRGLGPYREIQAKGIEAGAGFETFGGLPAEFGIGPQVAVFEII